VGEASTGRSLTGALHAGKRGCKGTDPRMQLQAEVEKLRIVVSELEF